MLVIAKLIFLFFLTVFVSSDDNLVRLELTPEVEGRVRIQWFSEIEDFDSMILVIESSIQTNEINLYEQSGEISGCCFYEEITITLRVIADDLEYSIQDSVLPTSTDLEFIDPILVPTTLNNTTTTTTTLFSPDEQIIEDGISLIEENINSNDEVLNLSVLNLSNILEYDYENNFVSSISVLNYDNAINNSSKSAIFNNTLILFILLLILQLSFNFLENRKIEYLLNMQLISKKLSLKTRPVVVTLTMILVSIAYSQLLSRTELVFDENSIMNFSLFLIAYLFVALTSDGIEIFVEKYYYNTSVYYSYSFLAFVLNLIFVIIFLFSPFDFLIFSCSTLAIRHIYNRGEVSIPPKIYSRILLLLTIFSISLIYEAQTFNPYIDSVLKLIYFFSLSTACASIFPILSSLYRNKIEQKNSLLKLFEVITLLIVSYLFIYTISFSSNTFIITEDFRISALYGLIISLSFIFLSLGLLIELYSERIVNSFLFQRFFQNH